MNIKPEKRLYLLAHTQGFTLIELLVVIVIVGILSAIALPSFMGQARKATQAAAKAYVGSMNRAQQSYFMENNQFADVLTTLGIGIPSQTTNYRYEVELGSGSNISVLSHGKPLQSHLRAYVGMVALIPAGTLGNPESLTMPVLCESSSPQPVATTPTFGSPPTCTSGTQSVSQ